MVKKKTSLPAESFSVGVLCQSCFPLEVVLFALPNRRQPKLILTAGSCRQRWRESAWLPAYRLSARLYRLAIRLAYSLAPKFFLMRGTTQPQIDTNKHGSRPPGTRNNHFESVGELKHEPNLRLVVRIGTADVRQKLTLLWLDQSSNIVKVTKLAATPLAVELVGREAQMLAALPSNVGPKLIRSTENSVTFEPVLGKSIAAKLPASPRDKLWQQIDRLLISFSTTIPASSLPYLASLNQTKVFPASNHPALRPLLEADARAINWVKDLSDRLWPIVIEHGDFAPWNLLQTENGLCAIDWEDGRLEGFPGVDLVHYIIQTGALMHKWRAERIRTYALERLQDAGFTVAEATATLKLAALRDCMATGATEQHKMQSLRQGLMK